MLHDEFGKLYGMMFDEMNKIKKSCEFNAWDKSKNQSVSSSV